MVMGRALTRSGAERGTRVPTGCWAVLGTLLLTSLVQPRDLTGQQVPPRISGRIVAADTGAPVVGATVTLRHSEFPDSLVHRLETNELGLFRVDRTPFR